MSKIIPASTATKPRPDSLKRDAYRTLAQHMTAAHAAGDRGAFSILAELAQMYAKGEVVAARNESGTIVWARR